ncbi:hypothetical protein [Dyella sp. AtDHG13]|uniref:hypothetical protein n=1 Tax=Dyella sp. AtDHG13 TaxID=1938897 RepID=UPI0011B56F7B|nr:hypothetical protein [Dyella sp. AtDHG13]
MLSPSISALDHGGQFSDLEKLLAATARTPGWNNRPRDIRQYQLGSCVLYVVPYRRWAWHRREREIARAKLDIAN